MVGASVRMAGISVRMAGADSAGPVEDIHLPAHYSIQQERLHAEKERLKALAEAKKQQVIDPRCICACVRACMRVCARALRCATTLRRSVAALRSFCDKTRRSTLRSR